MGDIVPLHSTMPDHLARQVWELVHPASPELAAFPAYIRHDPAAADWARKKAKFLEVKSTWDDCHEWFVLLCFGINGVNEDTFKQRELAIWSMCRELPAFVWCEDARHRLWGRTSFLPTPKEVYEELKAYVALLKREIDALQRIAEPQPEARYGEPYKLPPPPEWATTSPRWGSSPPSLHTGFEEKHGRAPGALSEAMLAVVRATVTKRAATEAGKGEVRPTAPDPPEAAD